MIAKVPTTESNTPFHRGRKLGILQTVGYVMASVYAEDPECFKQIEDEVLEWVEAHTGLRPPSMEDQ